MSAIKDFTTKYHTQIVLVGSILGAVGAVMADKITWKEALVAIIALLYPSALSRKATNGQ